MKLGKTICIMILSILSFVAMAEKATPAKANQYLVLAFIAPWCAPCSKIKPQLEKYKNASNVTVKVINVDNSPKSNLTKLYSIQALPTTFIIKNPTSSQVNLNVYNAKNTQEVIGANIKSSLAKAMPDLTIDTKQNKVVTNNAPKPMYRFQKVLPGDNSQSIIETQ